MTMILKSTAEQKAFVVGRQAALRSTADLVDQLTEQLHESQKELLRVRAECERKNKEVEEILSAMTQLRLAMFAAWQRRDSDRLQ
jgi:hypothetical protein